MRGAEARREIVEGGVLGEVPNLRVKSSKNVVILNVFHIPDFFCNLPIHYIDTPYNFEDAKSQSFVQCKFIKFWSNTYQVILHTS